MLTLKQRAATMMAVIEIEKRLTPQKAEKLIIEGLRMLAEDCAKIADGQHSDCSVGCCERRRTADSIACQIRALCEDGGQTNDR